jgi:hypothetical protein
MDYTKKDVSDLASGLAGPASVAGYEVGATSTFGLGLEVFDPEAGKVIIVARPHRADIGQEQILLSVDQVAKAVVAARIARASQDRAHGVLPIVVAVPVAIVKGVKARKAARKAKKAAKLAAAVAPKKAKKVRRRKHKK